MILAALAIDKPEEAMRGQQKNMDDTSVGEAYPLCAVRNELKPFLTGKEIEKLTIGGCLFY